MPSYAQDGFAIVDGEMIAPEAVSFLRAGRQAGTTRIVYTDIGDRGLESRRAVLREPVNVVKKILDEAAAQEREARRELRPSMVWVERNNINALEDAERYRAKKVG